MYRGDPTFVDANSLVPGDIISLEAQAARLFSRLRGLFCTMFSSRKRISDFEIDEQARPVKVFTILIVDILLLRIFGTSHRYRRERTATTVSFESQYMYDDLHENVFSRTPLSAACYRPEIKCLPMSASSSARKGPRFYPSNLAPCDEITLTARLRRSHFEQRLERRGCEQREICFDILIKLVNR